MTRLGITGHQGIPTSAQLFVSNALEREITTSGPSDALLGITSLAVGADQIFANLIVRTGGHLHVIIPCAGYEKTFEGDALRRFQTLLSMATKVDRLDFDEPSEEAFFAAGRAVVKACDLLLAVWDGKASRGLGGTGDIVAYAQSTGKPVRVLWPAGVSR